MHLGSVQRCRRGYLPLWMAVVLALLVIVALSFWTMQSMSSETPDGRQTIVFWGAIQLGEDIYAVINQFEHLPENLDANGHPRYRVIMGTATSPDPTSDEQRLLCAVAGKVPPDVVWFDRFAIGEWASRNALENLSPYIAQQKKDDPNRLDLSEFYDWAIKETSYRRPGTNDTPGIYGIPLDVDLRLLFCNSDLLRQEGLVDAKGRPQPPRTWEELRQYANALTRFNRAGDKSSGIARLGFAPNYGNSWLYMFAWEAGGQFMNADRTKVTLDAPPNVRALRFMTDIYDDLGGFAQVDAFQDGFLAGALDPFLQGNVAMKIDGVWSMTDIADWKPNMDFLVVPAPIPADRLAAGYKPITWGGGFSLIMPTTARNKQGAWKLIQYLCSKQVMLQPRKASELKESAGRLYLPKSVANRVVFEELVRRYVEGNPKIPLTFQKAYAVAKEMMPQTLYRPVTPVGQRLWIAHLEAYDHGVHHTFLPQAKAQLADKIKTGKANASDVENEEMHLSLANAQAPVQEMLDDILTPLPASSEVNWTPWLICYAIAALLPLGMIWIVYRAKRKYHVYRASEVRASLLFASPWMIGFAVFVGGPIFFSIIFSFTKYDVLSPAWVGMANFWHLANDNFFYISLWNTAYMIVRVPLTMAASLVIALLLNRSIRGLSFYRTICYMPANVPIVAAALLWTWIFSPDSGILNNILTWIYQLPPIEWLQHLLGVHFTAPLWLKDQYWSKPALILMSIWSSGGGMIIWLAGLQSIPAQLYEAASIDGAGPLRRFLNVTVPMLSPYILFNFIIGVIGTMQIFNEAFVMTQGGPNNSTLFYAYQLFRQAFQYFRMGYASALAWILFLIVLTLTLLQLWLSKRWVHYDQT